MLASTNVVPMSGCSITSSPARKNTMVMGRTVLAHCLVRPARRARRSAPKTTRASFISSDGWIRNEPVPTQRLDPSTSTPTPGTSTSTSRMRARPTRGTLRRLQMR